MKNQLPLALLFTLGGIFAAMGALLLYVALLKPMLLTWKSSSWIETPATVTECRLENRSRGAMTIVINYHYYYNKIKYCGNRYDFFRSNGNATSWRIDNMREIVRSLPPGTRTTCLVDPQKPSEAVISRKISLSPLSLLLPVLFLSIGVGMLLAAILSILSKKQTSLLPQVTNLFLTMRLDPQEQKEMAEYLNKRLTKDDLGQILLEDGSGYLTNADGEIISCDFDIRHEKMDKVKFEAILQNLNRVPFFTKGSYLKWQGREYPVGDKVILAIYLQKHEFAPEEFSDQALNTLIEKFCNTLGENCRYFSYWQNGKTTALYFYGKDHAVMQQSIAELLRTEKLCRNYKVVQLFESGEKI